MELKYHQYIQEHYLPVSMVEVFELIVFGIQQELHKNQKEDGYIQTGHQEWQKKNISYDRGVILFDENHLLNQVKKKQFYCSSALNNPQ